MAEEARERLLRGYSVGVRHPEVSGFEILDLLDLRSRITELEAELTKDEKRMLEEADSLFLNQAGRFYESLSPVANLAEMREQVGATPSHWWWYLERLAQVEKVAS